MARSILTNEGYSDIERAEECDLNEYHHVSFEKVLPSGIAALVELHCRLRNKRYGGLPTEWSDLSPLIDAVTSPYPHNRLSKDALEAHVLLESFEDGGSFRHLVDLMAMKEAFKDTDINSSQVISDWGLSDARTYWSK